MSEELPAKRELQAGASAKAIVPTTMEDAFRIATAVVASGMAPKEMNTQEKCLVAIMTGLELGMNPMQSVQRIAVINGRPTIWGDAAIGLVRASGLCEFVKEWIEGEGDEMVAYCQVKRKGEPEPVTGSFSVLDAKTASLWGKQGPWKSYPKRMLQMRARGFVLRDVFGDVLGGMYLHEEMQDDPQEMKDVTPKADRFTPPAPPQAVVSVSTKDFDDSGEAEEDEFDPEAWLEDLDTQLSAAQTEDEVNEIWIMTGEDRIESGVVPEDANIRALALYSDHVDRVSNP